ncbi:MAG TPA: hypothetical protein VME66_13355 [Candidatus Acidoferrales bacterium]|nr:hypothetical protein [Candidatus Acidoferrales bacterium]
MEEKTALSGPLTSLTRAISRLGATRRRVDRMPCDRKEFWKRDARQIVGESWRIVKKPLLRARIEDETTTSMTSAALPEKDGSSTIDVVAGTFPVKFVRYITKRELCAERRGEEFGYGVYTTGSGSFADAFGGRNGDCS